MLMKKSYLVVLTFLLFLNACGIIAINENDYRALPKTYYQYIKPFTPALVTKTVNYSDSVFLYEINTPEIKKCLARYKYVWIHLWRPYCEADYCQNITFFEQLAKRYQKKKLQLLFISQSYDPLTVKKIMENSSFHKPVFVLDDASYGHKLRKAHKLFFRELNNNPAFHSKNGFDDLLFKDTLLVYAGNRMTARVLDSLMGSMGPEGKAAANLPVKYKKQ